MLFERVEALFPKLPVLLNPLRGLTDRPGVDPATVDASGLAARHEPGLLEHAQVPRDRRERHAVRLGQLAGRSLPLRQAFQHAAPNRVGQRGEDGVQRVDSIFNHRVKYILPPPVCKALRGPLSCVDHYAEGSENPVLGRRPSM